MRCAPAEPRYKLDDCDVALSPPGGAFFVGFVNVSCSRPLQYSRGQQLCFASKDYKVWDRDENIPGRRKA